MKTQLFFLLFVNLFFYSNSQSQKPFDHIEYKKECNSAYNLALFESKYKESIELLRAIENKYGVLYGEENILLAYNYSKIGNTNLTAESLRIAWSSYFFDFNLVWESEELSPAELMKKLSDKEKSIVKIGYEEFVKLKTSFSDSINNVLVRMVSIDQEPRLNPTDSLRFTENIIASDSLNLRDFQRLIRSIGYPGERLLPGYGNPASILLIHSSYYKWFYDEMKDELLEQLRVGNMAPSDYVLWLDRYNYEFYNSLNYGVLNIPEAQNYSDDEKKIIRGKRLEFGLIEIYPIPSERIAFK